MTIDNLSLMRRAITLSHQAKANGNHPFGAILADPNGNIVLEAENSVTTQNDVTNHAELNLISAASKKFTHEELESLTLYTSCEPCAMCSGAIFWSGIRKVVYGLSESGLISLVGEGAPVLSHPCRNIFANGSRTVEVVGPVLKDEAAEPHLGFWK